MINKRLIATITLILCSTLAYVASVVWCKLPPESTVKLFEVYAYLNGVVMGAYKVSQTFTDNKKIQNHQEA